MISLWKKKGETPLQALDRLRVERPELANEKMTYAGRLDPLAEGELLVLVGEECKEKEKYLGLDKEYEAEILFGFRTDTGDLMGKVVEVGNAEIPDEFLDRILLQCIGKQIQAYPAYSSKTVEGKALFQYARDGEEVEMPTREIEIYSIELLRQYSITDSVFLSRIKDDIALVDGDFRQEEIIKCWKTHLDTQCPSRVPRSFPVIKIRVACSSGTYIRVLAEKIASGLGTVGLAFEIVRTKIFSS